MKTIKFGNPGEIDPRVFSTFGVSAKETENAIGQFGTGLKYAIAVCLREGRSIWIESGDECYEFALQSVDIRGEPFEQITCNGEPMPFTTHLGSKWSLWQAYRELYSNCRDEGGDINQEGETTVCAELGDVDHTEVFLDPERVPLVSTKWVDVYPGQSRVVYVKGIRAHDLRRESLFTYDLKLAELTEDRTIKYSHQIDLAIINAVFTAQCRQFVRDFLLHTKGYFEETLDACFSGNIPPSEMVTGIVKQYRRENVYMHKGVRDSIISVLGFEAIDTEEMTEREQRIITKAKAFCEKIDMPVTYPVYKGDLGAGVLGQACKEQECIYLSRRSLEMGLKQVTATLIEENLHLAEGLDDCTYEMQTRLFDIIVTMGEKYTDDIL